MKMNKNKHLLFYCLCMFLDFIAFSQEYSIQIPATKIAQNQGFEIKAVCKDGTIKSCTAFPDITGFKKGGTSQQSQIQMNNGNVSKMHMYAQTYYPTKQGTFTLKPFDLIINDKKVHSNGVRITVTAPVQRQQNIFDLFSDPFGNDPFFSRTRPNGPIEYVDIKDDAFFSVNVSKKEAYLGEAIHIEAAFYTAEDNKARFSWFEEGKQVQEIAEKLLPKNCWYEKKEIVNLQATEITINGKKHNKYILFESIVFPYKLENIKLPSIPLKMIKYKEAKKAVFGRSKHKQDYKTFYTSPKTIKIKDLPPHPLKEKVAVGNFYLKEKLENKSNVLQTNESIKYDFTIKGEGNINILEAPTIVENKELTFFEPTSSQDIEIKHGQLKGRKKFNYFIIPQEAGEYNLGDYLQWIFFNPRTEKYDTLSSSKIIRVEGESMKNKNIENADLGEFYDQIKYTNNTLSNLEENNTWKWLANISIFLMLVIVVTFGIKKQKKDE